MKTEKMQASSLRVVRWHLQVPMRKRESAGSAEAGFVFDERSTGILRADMILFVEVEFYLRTNTSLAKECQRSEGIT